MADTSSGWRFSDDDRVGRRASVVVKAISSQDVRRRLAFAVLIPLILVAGGVALLIWQPVIDKTYGARGAALMVFGALGVVAFLVVAVVLGHPRGRYEVVITADGIAFIGAKWSADFPIASVVKVVVRCGTDYERIVAIGQGSRFAIYTGLGALAPWMKKSSVPAPGVELVRLLAATGFSLTVSAKSPGLHVFTREPLERASCGVAPGDG